MLTNEEKVKMMQDHATAALAKPYVDRVCLSYWFPKLQATGVAVPKTRIVTTDVRLIQSLDGIFPSGFHSFLDELRAAIAEVGGYPAFLRTGHGSGKHQWLDTCFVQQPDVAQHVANLVEWSECVDMRGLPYKVWAVREFLRLASTFTAFNGFPVNRERRYFIGGGKVLCAHPYWPADAVEGHTKAEFWREKLHVLNEQPADEVALLTTLSEQVAAAFVDDGAWSLDWAMDFGGKWWAIDMAPAERSYHWPGCPVAKEFR